MPFAYASDIHTCLLTCMSKITHILPGPCRLAQSCKHYHLCNLKSHRNNNSSTPKLLRVHNAAQRIHNAEDTQLRAVHVGACVHTHTHTSVTLVWARAQHGYQEYCYGQTTDEALKSVGQLQLTPSCGISH